MKTVKAPQMPEYALKDKESGMLSAYSFVEVTDIFGNTKTRRISHGRVHCVRLSEAERMVKVARDTASQRETNRHIYAEFTLEL